MTSIRIPEYKHTPVMLKEVLEYLNPRPGQFFTDCTLGGGGYTIEIAKRVGGKGRVLAIDLDELAIKNAELRVKSLELNNVILTYGNFRDLQKIVKEKFKDEEAKFSGIVFDLGLSSAQLADKSRGFSFQLDAPLDMRFAHHRSNTDLGQIYTDTQIIVNKWRREELEKIIREYGEERFAGRIARKIVECRKKKPIKTTGELVEIVASAVPAAYKRKKIHFATRTFQALRIATNKELENLEIALPQAVELLKKGGRLAVISYHSLEDRIVKRFFKKESKNCLCLPDLPVRAGLLRSEPCAPATDHGSRVIPPGRDAPTCQCGHIARLKILTRKVAKPAEEEIKNNPRARSAKLRVAERI